jgi:hypothetical protein
MHAANLNPFSGELLWQADFGSSDPENENNPIDVRQAPDRSVFVEALTNDASVDSTATLYKLTGSFADDIFSNGCD